MHDQATERDRKTYNSVHEVNRTPLTREKEAWNCMMKDKLKKKKLAKKRAFSTSPFPPQKKKSPVCFQIQNSHPQGLEIFVKVLPTPQKKQLWRKLIFKTKTYSLVQFTIPSERKKNVLLQGKDKTLFTISIKQFPNSY